MESLSTLALRPLERLINHGIEKSSTAQAMAAALDGKSLEVRADGTLLALRLSATAGRVRLGPAGEALQGSAPSATLAGGLLSIIGTLRGDPEARIRDGELRITGDTDVAGQFRDLLHMARPDLEDELAQLIGDPMAHQIGSFAHAFAEWGSRAAGSVARSVGEYLTEERQVLPTRTEVEEFCREVDTLASDADRAAERLSRLRGRTDGEPR
jgi:ubiquinone biosynthesis accessory factor UbiJ